MGGRGEHLAGGLELLGGQVGALLLEHHSRLIKVVAQVLLLLPPCAADVTIPPHLRPV